MPGARLHLTHVSTAASLAQVRAAKAAGLPVTCDVTPHHLALTDEWIAGSRRWAWDAVDGDGARARPVGATASITAAPFDTVAAGQPAAAARRRTRSACLAALADGTADAIATDHAPHTEVDKHVEFGWAANGISGIETALGIVLAAVDAGRPAARPRDRGADDRPGRGPRASRGAGRRRPFGDGEPADLVVVDRGATWRVEPGDAAVEGQELAAARARAARAWCG